MKMRPMILASVLLGGCATVADLREQAPFISTSTNKSVQDFGSCLANQWEARSGVTSSAPRPAGMSLTLSYTVYSSRMVAAHVDVDDTGASRTVTVYARKGDDNDTLRREITACT